MYEDDDVITSIRLVRKFEINKRSGFVRFSLDLPIYSALIDFSKGYKKYELQTAMQFESVSAMRFYELMSGLKEPIEFKIETLKEMFSISDKYKRVNDFIQFVLDVAKKELDEKSPYSFNYEPKKQGRAYHSIIFFPKFNPNNRDEELERKSLQKQVSLSWDLPKNVVDYLKHNFNFTTDGIKNNIDLFKSANNKFDLIQFLAEIKGKTRNSDNPQGYVIGAIRK
jgi:plasmid replication initiation protein